VENTTKIDTFSSYETKAYEYCASIGQPVLLQPLNKFDGNKTVNKFKL
jgi:hypothetical protein